MSTTADEAAQIIAELINATEALRWAMFNSDSEISWAAEKKRWDDARKAALEAYPGVKARLED